jgi:hypothetical protein
MVIPNDTPEPYTFALSKMNATQLEGGTVKIVDSSTFKVSKTIAAALVTVDVSILLFTCFKCSSAFSSGWRHEVCLLILVRPLILQGPSITLRELHVSACWFIPAPFSSDISGTQRKQSGVILCTFGICLLPALWSLTLPRLDSSGQARITSFASQGNAQTFDFQASGPFK